MKILLNILVFLKDAREMPYNGKYMVSALTENFK